MNVAIAQSNYSADGVFMCDSLDESPSEASNLYQLRASSYIWKPGDLPSTGSTSQKLRIGVWFLNGTDAEKNAVRQFASYWTNTDGASVEWVFDQPNMKHIRIKFGPGGSWSKLGSYALKVTNQNEPTMYLNLKTSSGTQRVVLHEFGHALGLMHEHLHPNTGFVFRTSRVFRSMVGSGWCSDNSGNYSGDIECLEKIEQQITIPLDKSYRCPGSPNFDPKSIMMYPILDGWLFDNKKFNWSNVLSDEDKRCVKSLYSDSLSLCRPVGLQGQSRLVKAFATGVAVNSQSVPVCYFVPNQTFAATLQELRDWFVSYVSQVRDPIFLPRSSVKP